MRPRCGLTLVELLVVIVLITTLLTTAIPVLAPGGDKRRLREASRAVNSFFAGAQARAIETGRPYGVAIKRLSAVTGNVDDSGAGVELSYVEVPPVYAGLDATSMVRIAEVATGPLLKQLRLQFVRRSETTAGNLPPGWAFDLVPGSFLRPGDTIVTGSTAYVFQADSGDGTAGLQPLRQDTPNFFVQVIAGDQFGVMPQNDLDIAVVEDGIASLAREVAWSVEHRPRYNRFGAEVNLQGGATLGEVDADSGPFWTTPAPYQIYRQAVPATGQPLQLPAGTAIDLAASGFGNGVALHRPSDLYGGDPRPSATRIENADPFTDDVVIMFSPEGSISSARFHPAASAASQETKVTSALALCIGRNELIPGEVDEDDPNATIDNPIDISRFRLDPENTEAQETMARYNVLNLDTRWVVIGAQTGSVLTVETADVNPATVQDADNNERIEFAEQRAAALANAPARLTTGGR